MLALWLNDAETPWMVTVAKPRVDVELAASVSVLVPVAGFGLNVAVTPLGSPTAVSVTFPLNPFSPATVIVLVTLPPSVTVRVPGAADSVKPCVDPARASIKPCPLGLPHPVARS